MQEMMLFCSWLFTNIPTFLLSEPISALTALFILGCVSDLVRRMMGVSR